MARNILAGIGALTLIVVIGLFVLGRTSPATANRAAQYGASIVADGAVPSPVVGTVVPSSTLAAPTTVPSQPTTGQTTTTASTADGECPSPEVLSKMLAINGQGPAFRSIGNPLWLNPSANRDKDDVCVFEFNRNSLGGKDFLRYQALPGVVVTSNEKDNTVKVWNGQPGLIVESSAATLRVLDNPVSRKPIYSLTHRFRDSCALIANEHSFTEMEKAAGGFTSIHAKGSVSCDNNVPDPAFLGINAMSTTTSAATTTNGATTSAGSTSTGTTAASGNANDLLKLFVKDDDQRKYVECKPGNGKTIVCEGKRGPVTITHPGGNAEVDYWSGSPAPANAIGCQVNVNGPTRMVVCANAGATMKDDHFTITPGS